MNRSAFLSALVAASLAASCGDSPSPTAPGSSTQSTPSGFSEAAFRQAAQVTAAAQIDARSAARPGLYERDLKTTIDLTFQRLGSGAPAFSHIVASGSNTLEVHYAGDGRQLADGDLVLIDIGATIDGHCADVTRTFPVSGQFTARQRELYDLALAAHQAVERQARTGVDSLAGLHQWVKEYFRQSPLRATDTSGVEQTMDRFFTYSIGHYVGRTVHGQDTGWSTQQPLQAGQVLAIEPGFYLPDEKLGVRVEDTFLVTSQGLECLSCASSRMLGAAPPALGLWRRSRYLAAGPNQ